MDCVVSLLFVNAGGAEISSFREEPGTADLYRRTVTPLQAFCPPFFHEEEGHICAVVGEAIPLCLPVLFPQNSKDDALDDGFMKVVESSPPVNR